MGLLHPAGEVNQARHTCQGMLLRRVPANDVSVKGTVDVGGMIGVPRRDVDAGNSCFL